MISVLVGLNTDESKENQNMGKITLIPLILAGLGLVISCLVFGRPDYFNLSPQQVNIRGIITVLLGFTGASIFLSNNT